MTQLPPLCYRLFLKSILLVSTQRLSFIKLTLYLFQIWSLHWRQLMHHLS